MDWEPSVPMDLRANEQVVLYDRRIAYAVADRDLLVRQVRGSHNILQDDAATWPGKSLLDLFPELVGSEDALCQILAGALPRLEIPWVNRDGEGGKTTYLTFVDLPYRDITGAIVGIVHVTQDVTEIGAVEQQLMQHRNDLRLLEKAQRDRNVQLLAANAELRRLDEAKSSFVSIAAHELRTPLTSITGYVEMLLDGDAGPLNRQQTEYLDAIEASAQRLLRITRDLLDVARIESGRLELLLQTTDLKDLLARVAAEQMPQLEARSQRICLSAADGIPMAFIDPQRTAQVIGNLINNASKYAPVGTLITIELDEAVDEPGFLRVAVKDEGDGIPVEDRDLLFRPFFRGASAQSTGAPGTGLGLYIAQSLVELHGGQISVESTPGAGAAFLVTFPIALGTPTSTAL